MRGNRSESNKDCLDDLTLQRLLLGKVHPAQAAGYFSHLEACENCAARAAEFDTLGDDVVERLRDPSIIPLEKEAGYRRLMEKIGHFASEDDPRSDSPTGRSSGTSQNRQPPRQFRDYEIRSLIGRGGMGAVYHGWHTRLKRSVAIKVISAKGLASPNAEHRFTREVEAIGQIEHPLIVRATDAGVQDEWHYLVMEYVDGLNLSQICSRLGPLRVVDTVAIIRAAAIGLDFAHLKDVVHRDVKPSNLMIARDGRLKILDLSLARMRRSWEELLADDDDSARSHTASETTYGRIMGTADYMSPEQSMDFREADRRADIYSLGVTMYRLLTGRVPFPYDTVDEKLSAHQDQAPPSLASSRPDVSPQLEAVFQKMLAKSPDQRYQSMLEVVEALDQVQCEPTGLTAAYRYPVYGSRWDAVPASDMSVVGLSDEQAAKIDQAQQLMTAFRERLAESPPRSYVDPPQKPIVKPTAKPRTQLTNVVLVTLLALSFVVLAGISIWWPSTNDEPTKERPKIQLNRRVRVVHDRTWPVRSLQWIPAWSSSEGETLPNLELVVGSEKGIRRYPVPRKPKAGERVKPDFVTSAGFSNIVEAEASPHRPLWFLAGSENRIFLGSESFNEGLEFELPGSKITAADVCWNTQTMCVGTQRGDLIIRRWHSPGEHNSLAFEILESADNDSVRLDSNSQSAIRKVEIDASGRWIVLIQDRIHLLQLSDDSGDEEDFSPSRTAFALASNARAGEWTDACVLDDQAVVVVASTFQVEALSLADLDGNTRAVWSLEGSVGQEFSSISYCPQRGVIVLGRRDGSVSIHRASDGEELARERVHPNQAVSTAILHDQLPWLATCCEPGIVDMIPLKDLR